MKARAVGVMLRRFIRIPHARSCVSRQVRMRGDLMAADHRDTGSTITLSVLLSDPREMQGGELVTWAPPTAGSEAGASSELGATGQEPTAIMHPLERGDGLLFRSEDFHNVLPVRAGVRRSLVIELWTGEANCEHRNG